MLTAKRAAGYLTGEGEFDNSPVVELAQYTGEGGDSGGGMVRPVAGVYSTSSQASAAGRGDNTGAMTGFEKESRESSRLTNPEYQMTPAEREMREASRNQQTPSGRQPGSPATVTGTVGDPNSPEERLKTLEQSQRANQERNQQLESRIKVLEPKPFYEPSPDGGGVIHIPPAVSSVIGAGIGALGGGVGILPGAAVGATLSQIPIHVSPEAPNEPYVPALQQGID